MIVKEPPSSRIVDPAETTPAASTDQLTDHAYDGIQEYDNPMPAWWKWLFVATIVYSVVYYGITLAYDGRMSAHWDFKNDRAEEIARQNSRVLGTDGVSLLALMNDEPSRSGGAAVFATQCAVCHNRDGSGMVGPNLTDEVYLNVRTIEEIPKFIRAGSKTLTMPPFTPDRLSNNDLAMVSAYVATLRGQNKPGKAAEGVPISPWSASAPPATGPATAPATSPATQPR